MVINSVFLIIFHCVTLWLMNLLYSDILLLQESVLRD